MSGVAGMPRCAWCGLRVDVAPLVVDSVVVGWLCRRLHLRPRTEQRVMQAAICAVCARRPAIGFDDVDGRRVPVCGECKNDESGLCSGCRIGRDCACDACRQGAPSKCLCEQEYQRVAPAPKEPETRERVLRILSRADGLDIAEVAEALGEDTEHGRAKLSAALARACRLRLVRFSGHRMDRTYSITPRGRTALQHMASERDAPEVRP